MPRNAKFDHEHFYVDESQERHKFGSLSNSGTLTLSVVVPAKDEERRLPCMLDECLDYLDDRTKHDSTFTWEVIIVDDGSTDGTTRVGHEYTAIWSAEKVRVLTLRRNIGKGGAVREGMMCARGRQILFADADGATTFADCSKLREQMADGGDNNDMMVVCGSRAHLEEESISSRSLFRTILMVGFHYLVWLFCVRTIHDTQCGFKMFTRPAARRLFPNMHIERWAFDVEVLFLAEAMRIECREVAVRWTEIDGSKITPVLSWLQMGRDIVLIWAKYKLGIWVVHDQE